jgi:hypothetical protein
LKEGLHRIVNNYRDEPDPALEAAAQSKPEELTSLE